MTVYKMRKEAIEAYVDVYQFLENLEHDVQYDYKSGTEKERNEAWNRHQVIMKTKGHILRKLEQ